MRKPAYVYANDKAADQPVHQSAVCSALVSITKFQASMLSQFLS